MPWLHVAALCLLAGAAMPLGAALASIERIRPDWLEQDLRHGIIAFGGGALLSAVALVLVPDGADAAGPFYAPLCLLLGAAALMALDLFLARRRSAAGQLVAMLADFVPESIALGAAFASGSQTGLVIALMIALQNLPEGFNAFRELKANTQLPNSRILSAFGGMALLGPAAGLTGLFWLSATPLAVGVIELFAAGGILYLIFQDIAPQAKLEKHWTPPLGAVLGFSLGLVGHLLAHA